MSTMPLPDDDLRKWEYKEHTKVKHEILSKYLATWMKILGTYHDLHIFDCFAGRGCYTDGSEGSPLKILNILINLREKQSKPQNAHCYFIEKNPENWNNLVIEIEKLKKRRGDLPWLSIDIFNSEFSEIIENILTPNGDTFGPAFFFLDPFGFGGIPLEIIKKLLSYERTEVFITFMIRDVNRFLDSPSHQGAIEQLFAMDYVIEKLNEEPYSKLPREQAILRLYRNRLHDYAGVKYTMPFQVSADKKLQTTYYLIYCTNHPKGCELMKEIMSRAGTKDRFGYLGPAEGQFTLEQYCGTEQLKNFLLKIFKNKTMSFEEVRYKTLMDTWANKSQYREAIKELESDMLIEINKKGPRNGIRDDTLIKFKRIQKTIIDFFDEIKNK